MIDETQLHLDAVARTMLPLGIRLRTTVEPIRGGSGAKLYTLILEPEGEWAYSAPQRFFAIHSSSLRQVGDEQLRSELAAAFGQAEIRARPFGVSRRRPFTCGS